MAQTLWLEVQSLNSGLGDQKRSESLGPMGQGLDCEGQDLRLHDIENPI